MIGRKTVRLVDTSVSSLTTGCAVSPSTRHSSLADGKAFAALAIQSRTYSSLKVVVPVGSIITSRLQAADLEISIQIRMDTSRCAPASRSARRRRGRSAGRALRGFRMGRSSAAYWISRKQGRLSGSRCFRIVASCCHAAVLQRHGIYGWFSRFTRGRPRNIGSVVELPRVNHRLELELPELGLLAEALGWWHPNTSPPLPEIRNGATVQQHRQEWRAAPQRKRAAQGQPVARGRKLQRLRCQRVCSAIMSLWLKPMSAKKRRSNLVGKENRRRDAAPNSAVATREVWWK